MISRREFVVGTASTIALRKAMMLQAADATSVDDPLRYVKPMIGTGGDGHCVPGATVPFGAVQLSPDTGRVGWAYCGGYDYKDSSIVGFSHTHISGTGVGDMLDVSLMPSIINPALDDEEGRVGFSHVDEFAEAGYYSVKLWSGVRAELTATERVGVHRYTFPTSDHAHFFLDMADMPESSKATRASIVSSELEIVDDHTITGGRETEVWANDRSIFFVMQFSRPFSKTEIFSGGVQTAGKSATGRNLSARIFFDTASSSPILVKTGISGVSIDGAWKNLRAEAPGWDFDAVRNNAAAAWRTMLSRIKVTGGTEKQKQIFYTGLYHTMAAPTLFDDVDGQYAGMDSKIHKLAAGQHNYSTFSLWDTYRATHPLYTLVLPERVPEFVNCLIRMSNESPLGPPVWPLQGKETSCMTGYHSAVVIAEAATKNFPGIDFQAAWTPYSKRAMEDDYQGLALYRSKGYIPCDREGESCSKTTDYCYDDWAVAHIAKYLGHDEVYRSLVQRAGNYTNLYDPSVGFIRPRLDSGEWSTPFAPNEMGHSDQWRDYTESNPWQTTLAVPHDPAGLAKMLGGRKALEAKLDGIFNADPTQPANGSPDIAGLVGQYAHGNEPSHHIAYLYVYAGAPHKTQERVVSLLDTMYDNKPNGLAGNEDCGQMSAWYIMSALGFYAVDPVSGNYVFGSPLFDQATINLGGGRMLTLEAKRKSPSDKYIHAIDWNGKPHNRLWFSHADIVGGGTFVLTMGAEPKRDFGSAEPTLPPSRSS